MEQTSELRRSGIGGSDASVILGINPWKTPLQLYMEKTGQVEGPEENQAMHIGTILEDVIADEYSRQTGSKVSRVNETIRHPDYDWMMAHVDRRVLNFDGGKLLECKTAGRFYKQDEWGRHGENTIPAYYFAQIQHYHAVTGWQYSDVAALLGGSDFRIYHFERDSKFIDNLIQKEIEFWYAVERRVPPEPINLDDVKLMFPKDAGTEIKVTDEIYEIWENYIIANEHVKEVQARAEMLKLMIQKYMGENSLLVDSEGKKLVSWKTQSRETIDTKRLREEMPEIFEKFSKQSTTRVFK